MLVDSGRWKLSPQSTHKEGLMLEVAAFRILETEALMKTVIIPLVEVFRGVSNGGRRLRKLWRHVAMSSETSVSVEGYGHSESCETVAVMETADCGLTQVRSYD